ncbi:MAG: DNA polymerase Y family protein [Patescibacteria group bacterium]
MNEVFGGKTILHIDINSYFASLLQQQIPSLRAKPLAVVKDIGRTCIIAASKEAKLLGIKTGDNVHEWQSLVDLKVAPCDFSLFLSATKKLQRVFSSFSPDVRIFSLDEVFIDYTPLQNLYGSAEEFATKIQDQIHSVLGGWVDCNVGIGPNRFLAKMTGEVSAKGSVTRVDESNLMSLLSRVEFRDVCGIGYRLSKKLARLGVYHPLQISFFCDEELVAHFGKFWAKELRKMSQGQEPHLLSHSQDRLTMKSVSRSITGFHLINSEVEIKKILYNLVEEVIHKVRRMNLAGRLVGFSLYGGYGQKRSISSYLTLQRYIRNTKEMFDLIYNQLYLSRKRDFPIIRFRVFLAMLQPWVGLSLLEEDQKREKIACSVDKLNQKYGLFTVTSGLLTDKQKIIRPEVTGFFGDKQFQLMNN